jgi:hypothetical protein
MDIIYRLVNFKSENIAYEFIIVFVHLYTTRNTAVIKIEQG